MISLLAEAFESAKKKGIDLSNKKKICISLDVNGPLTATDSAALEPYPGIKDALKELKELGTYIIINSAWDLDTLKIFDQKKLGSIADGFIAENGAVYALREGETFLIGDNDLEKHRLDLFMKVMKTCSEKDISFASQGNQVNASYYHEFEKGLAENICRQGKPRPTEKEFFDKLKKNGIEARINDNGIEIGYSRDKCGQLLRILSQEYRLVTIRPYIRKDKVLIKLSDYKDRNISLSDLNEMARNVTSELNGWCNYRVNDDFCIDYFLSKNILKREVTKAIALNILLKHLCDQINVEYDSFLILGIGDGENDSCIRKIKNALFFAIDGTKSENDCDMKISGGLKFLNIAKSIAESVNKKDC